MKTIFLVLLIASFSFAYELKDKEMGFMYIPFEGGGEMSCTHSRIRDLPDWKVNCGKKEFAAHIVIREYQKSSEPQTGLEILYWITDRNSPSPIFNSGTHWINLKKKTSLDSLILSQGVENDYANVQFEWHPRF